MSDTQVALEELCEIARASGRLALDTEFVGEGRYRTLLCLIQLAVTSSDGADERIELLDPLADDFDAGPLAQLLADPTVQIVLHAGRQDIALARRVLATEVTNVFDTQVAAAFAGMGAQSSYDSLMHDALGVRLSKSASFTRWDARPLSAEQLEYARGDVEQLLELSEELERRLRALGRLEWAREECAALEQSSDERNLDTVFARLPRVRNLSPSARPIARALVRWREETAASRDRPVQGVLSDAALIEIAKRKPRSSGELEQIRGAGAANLRKRGEDLLAVVRQARELPTEDAPRETRPPAPKPEDAPLIALAEALLRARAREANIAYELIAARADLQAVVAAWRTGTAEADVRTLRGWRRELAGAELLALLDGELSLSVLDGKLHISSPDAT
ncbi:MAG TPA: HRDC domain-containing protein [Solirubrobacteraceae bacterium]|jgi:ribonuclease D|nr:HRDC domain-containing protein [Solirubrobacteraceae bacterium]